MGYLAVTDCLAWMRERPDNWVDLVMGSPPYEDARILDGAPVRKGQDWVNWMKPIILESIRICSGLVVFVVEGRTKNFRWSATPALLMADLHRQGVHLRKPPIIKRYGIPGSGGQDWLRNDYEFCLCATSGGPLPWSDNVAMGRPCKYRTGGAMSNRTSSGKRRNAKTGKRLLGNNGRPDVANPGNVIDCGAAGGGNIGSQLAHENEAPYPEHLAEFFIRSFCRPTGTVLDPFCGSGTTCAVAERFGRDWIGLDIRESQIELSQRRIDEVRQTSTDDTLSPGDQ